MIDLSSRLTTKLSLFPPDQQGLDLDGFGSNRPKTIEIDSENLERDISEKRTIFSHPALRNASASRLWAFERFSERTGECQDQAGKDLNLVEASMWQMRGKIFVFL